MSYSEHRRTLTIYVKRNLFTVASILVVLVVLTLSMVFHRQLTNQLHSWKLLPEPERLTELYFAHPGSLPSTYVPGQQQTVSFTVHNLEYRRENYSYKIIEENQSGSVQVTLTGGSFVLTQNKYTNINRGIDVVDIASRVKIEVKLQSVNESIDYWLNRSGA